MALRNLPTDTAAPLASLINCKPGQVSSRSFTRVGDAAQMTLLAFAEGESVAEECYPGDTLYYLVEGETDITLPDECILMRSGDVFCVPAGIEHAIAPRTAIKLLQITA